MNVPAKRADEPLLMTHQDFLPSRIRSGELKLAKYQIHASGLASDSVGDGDVIIDHRIALIQPHPESTLYLCPISTHPQPTVPEAWFYCDCIAYEHDIPAMVIPTDRELSLFKHRYLHNGLTKPRTGTIHHLGNEEKDQTFTIPPKRPHVVTRTFLVNQLASILEMTRELRHGPFSYVLFRTYRCNRRIHLAYSETYGCVAKELSLYSAALRQADFLAEYLNYYRVIESTTQTNGKEWISNALQRLSTHKWLHIALRHNDEYGARPRSIISLYRKRIACRLRELRGQLGGDDEVAKYLYKVNRCGIVHGSGAIVRGEITTNYFDIARDGIVLKLLARMAIDEKRKLKPNKR